MQKIIYLPGWLNAGDNLRPLAGAVGGEYEILELMRPDRAMTVADYADWVAGMAAGPVFIAGHSFGGKVAIAAAARHPEKVRGIFVIAGSNRGRAVYRLLRPAVKLAKRLGFSGARFQAADYKNSTPLLKEIMQKTLDFDIMPMARRVRCPAVFIYGSLDAATPPALGRRLAAAAGGRFFQLGGFDHNTIMDGGIWQVSAIIKSALAGGC
jgi:pimeloyl-ACP methyl ester carboxylesterase